MRRVVHLVLTVVVVLVFGTQVAEIGAQKAGAKVDAKTLKNPVPATDASIQAGRQVFFKNCATCHGPKGLGNGRSEPGGTQPANFTDEKWDHGSTDGELFVVIRDGIAPRYEMDTFEDLLTVPEIWNVINYIRTLSAKNP